MRAPWLLPAIPMVAGALANLLGPRPHFGEPLLACTPLVACMILSFRRSIIVAVVTCLVSITSALVQGLEWSAWVIDGLAVVLVSILGLSLQHLSERQRRDLALARDVAEVAQRAVLPSPPSTVGALRAGDRYVAARVGTAVGGDFYALQDTPFGVRAVIGDVRGKGLQAVASVSVVVGAFREAAQHVLSLQELAEHLDQVLEQENERRARDVDSLEGFATALLLQVTPDGETLLLHNRGHTAPYLVREGTVRALEPSQPDLPLSTGLGRPSAGHSDEVALRPGDALILLTDGVTEARNPLGVFFDPSIGLAGTPVTAPQVLADTLVEKVLSWTCGERQDDMAILVLVQNPDLEWEAEEGEEGESRTLAG